jgi:hypothetical protein
VAGGYHAGLKLAKHAEEVLTVFVGGRIVHWNTAFGRQTDLALNAGSMLMILGKSRGFSESSFQIQSLLSGVAGSGAEQQVHSDLEGNNILPLMA